MPGETAGGKSTEPERHAPKKLQVGKLYFLPSDEVPGLLVPALVKKVNVKGLRKVNVTVETYVPDIVKKLDRLQNRNWTLRRRTYVLSKKKLKKKSYLRIDNENVSVYKP